MVPGSETGGKLLVVDGDFVSPTWISTLSKAITGFLQSIGLKRDVAEIPQLKTHQDILSRVHFRKVRGPMK